MLTVNMWLQTRAEGIGRKTAQALHGQFGSVEELIAADEDRITDALLDSRIFTMPGAAVRKARIYHAAIQDAAEVERLETRDPSLGGEAGELRWPIRDELIEASTAPSPPHPTGRPHGWRTGTGWRIGLEG